MIDRPNTLMLCGRPVRQALLLPRLIDAAALLA